MPFAAAEYQSRLARVREHMAVRKIDVLLIDQTEFLAYLTGCSLSENMYRACVVPREGSPFMILRAVDLGPLRESSWLTDFIAFADWDDPIGIVVHALKQHHLASGVIGIDEDSYCMPLKRFRHLQELLPEARFADFSGVLEVLRLHKSPAEIALLRRASEIGDQALAAAVAASGEGRSARDAAEAVHDVYMREGADTSRAGIITVATGNSFLHGNLTSRPLARGDVLHMEILPLYEGYSARLMRPAVVGPDAERTKLAQTLIDIQDRQLAAMRPGALAREIDAIARDSICVSGLRPDYLNITGYTLGYYPLSTPHTSDFSRVFLPNATWRLEAGMTFHMYVSAAGVAFSETVLVTETGAEVLTRAPRRLYVV